MQKTNGAHAAVFRDGPTLSEGVRKQHIIDEEIKKDIKA